MHLLNSSKHDCLQQDGTVPLSPDRAGERISYEHLITSLPVGTKVQLDLQRQGTDTKAEVTTVPAEFLIPRTDGHDCNPSYDPAASDAPSVNGLGDKMQDLLYC